MASITFDIINKVEQAYLKSKLANFLAFMVSTTLDAINATQIWTSSMFDVLVYGIRSSGCHKFDKFGPRVCLAYYVYSIRSSGCHKSHMSGIYGFYHSEYNRCSMSRKLGLQLAKHAAFEASAMVKAINAGHKTFMACTTLVSINFVQHLFCPKYCCIFCS